MQHLEGSGRPVLYIGRTVLKGYSTGNDGCFSASISVTLIILPRAYKGLAMG